MQMGMWLGQEGAPVRMQLSCSDGSHVEPGVCPSDVLCQLLSLSKRNKAARDGGGA